MPESIVRPRRRALFARRRRGRPRSRPHSARLDHPSARNGSDPSPGADAPAMLDAETGL